MKKRTIIFLVVAAIVVVMVWSTTFLSLSPAYHRDYKPVTLSDQEKTTIAESTKRLDKRGMLYVDPCLYDVIGNEVATFKCIIEHQ